MENKILTQFIIDQKPLKASLVLHSQTLSKIRAQIGISNSVSFLLEDSPIGQEDESELNLSYIAQNNKVYLATQKNDELTFLLNGKPFKSISVSLKMKLFDVRVLLNLKEEVFMLEDTPIEKGVDENDITLEAVAQNNVVYLLGQEETKETNKSETKRDSYEFVKQDGSCLGTARYESHTQLSKVREGMKFEKNLYFWFQKKNIDQDYEGKFTLAEVASNDNLVSLMDVKTERIQSLTVNPQDFPIKQDTRKPIAGSTFSKSLTEKHKINIYKYPQQTLTTEEKHLAKVMMVVGQTGSGKTTLLNSMINFHMGIHYEDPFRYILIEEDPNKSQAQSQTSEVNDYYIKPQGEKPPLIIVDSPGFGDTRGIDFDRTIVAMIKLFFETRLEVIHAVCFVAQASNSRLTASQKYILTEVLKLFGKDIAENFICLITFCDGNDPSIIEGLTHKESPFYDVKNSIKEPWFFKFNNSAFYQKSQKDLNQDTFNQMFWKIGMNSFENLYNKLKILPKKSLTQTREVLKIRQNLEVQILNLKAKHDSLLTLDNQLKKEIKHFENNKKTIDATKGYEVTREVPRIVECVLPPGSYVTNCRKCHATCHLPCGIEGDDKSYCYAMKDGYCTVCQQKCHHTEHANMAFYFKTTMVKEVGRLEDVYQRYLDAQVKNSKSEQIVEGLKADLQHNKLECLLIQSCIQNLIETLDKNALKTGVLDSQDQYIEEIIYSEKNQKNSGWEKRVESLNDLKITYAFIKEKFENPPTQQKLQEEIKSEQKKIKDKYPNLFKKIGKFLKQTKEFTIDIKKDIASFFHYS